MACERRAKNCLGPPLFGSGESRRLGLLFPEGSLAFQAKALMRDFAKQKGARRILLYSFGPLGAACFLGHRLNAVCAQIQVVERIGEPGKEYVPMSVRHDGCSL